MRTEQVAEVEVAPYGTVGVGHVTVAMDRGQVINANTIEAQVQGGLLFGLGAVLYGEITFRNGLAEQSNFNDYRVLRMNGVPAIDVHLVSSTAAAGGIGETATAGIFPAVTNAVFAAPGKRIRKPPVIGNSLV